MTINKALSLVILLMLSSPTFGVVTASDIAGKWSCGPYTMKGALASVSAVDLSTYSKDGAFSEESEATITYASGDAVEIKSGLTGTWKLVKGIIEIHFTSGVFLSSDNPKYTMEMGQRASDEQLRKKNWSKHRVLEFGKRLIYTPVDSMYKESEIVITCNRA